MNTNTDYYISRKRLVSIQQNRQTLTFRGKALLGGIIQGPSFVAIDDEVYIYIYILVICQIEKF